MLVRSVMKAMLKGTETAGREQTAPTTAAQHAQRGIAGDDGDNRFAEASCKPRPHACGDRLKKDSIPVTNLMISRCRAAQSNQTDTVQKGD